MPASGALSLFAPLELLNRPLKKLALNVTLSQGVPEGQPGVGLAVTFFSLFFVVDLVAKRQENGKIIYVNT